MLESILTALPAISYTVDSVTMRARHAYEQLGWQQGADLFTRELLGYDQGQELPPYRKVDCQRIWQTGDTWAALYETNHPDPRLAGKAATFDLRTGLGFLAQQGLGGQELRQQTAKTQAIPYTWAGRRDTATWAEWIVVSPSAVRHMLDLYRNLMHIWIGRAVIALHAGMEATPLWEILRADADRLASDAGVGDDLRSIVQAALTGRPSEMEGALVRCRNVIDKVSRYLYQAPGAAYPRIKDGTGKTPMAVDGNRYRNRLTAYLHQKGLNAEDRQLIDSHLNWFMGFVDLVNRLGSKGKGHIDISQRDVANGLMHTYLLLSEIAERTDGQPITKVL